MFSVRPPKTTQPSNSSADDSKYLDKEPGTSLLLMHDTLYIILGAVLGSLVVILIILVAICGFRQRQQRRSMRSKSNQSEVNNPLNITGR